MNIHKIQSKKGFTVVELLLYMGILSVLLITLTDVFSSIVNVRIESESTSAVEQDGDFILSRFMYDISHASSITSPTLGSSASALQIVISSVSNTYSLNSSNLQISNSNGTDVLNSINTTVSNLSFKQLGKSGGKNSIQINYTVHSKATQQTGVATKNYQTTIGLR